MCPPNEELASFPNSQIKPTPATLTSDTGVVTCAIAGGAPTLIKAANVNRVALMIRNTSTTENMRYGYANRNTLNVDGFLLKPGDGALLDDPGDIYGVSETAVTVDVCWDEGNG